MKWSWGEKLQKRKRYRLIGENNIAYGLAPGNVEREEFIKAFACYATTIDGLKFLSVVSPLSLIYMYIYVKVAILWYYFNSTQTLY